MKIGIVIGSVTCTQKVLSLEGIKLLLVQPVDESRQAKSIPIIACDTVQAGPDDLVIYEGGREASMALANWFNPSDATIMGIVDCINGEDQ